VGGHIQKVFAERASEHRVCWENKLPLSGQRFHVQVQLSVVGHSAGERNGAAVSPLARRAGGRA